METDVRTVRTTHSRRRWGVNDAIFDRRAVRHYSARDVIAETVQQLLVAAVQGPSAMNQQPWAFGVFHGRKRLQWDEPEDLARLICPD